ncbi:hypothetical protein NE577_15945, partial [Cloacibacillus evryensis]|nr:hypothetical protein [Cloacibacillus evryensis]
MGIAILATAITIYIIGIVKNGGIGTVLSADFKAGGFSDLPQAILNGFTYAAFQCVTQPTMVACGTPLINKKACDSSMWISFAMNTVALVLSVLMLLSWKSFYTSVDGGSVIPTLSSCREMGIGWLTAMYGMCLL